MTISLRSKILLSVASVWIGISSPAFAKNDDCDRELLGLLNKRSFHEALNSDAYPLTEIKALFAHRSPERQAQINRELTRLHAESEMSFQVKNPQTGMYDRFVAVPVTGSIAPIKEEDYKRLTDSTGPIMNTLRSLLQKIYSTPNWSVETLGLENLPSEEAAVFLRVLHESIYYIPALQNPAMKDYPFLAVAGFDGAIVDPVRPRAEFFEMNLGTPSGLSNNQKLLANLELADPELYRVISHYLPYDETYEILRHTIQSNAAVWTKRRGLSVVMSPGVYNGAHPDVARIAKLSRMPLVKPSDLYEDEKGDIRLNLNMGEGQDPLVTGIYGRIEESYFLQSQKHQIPMINPQFSVPESVRANSGMKFQPGAIYDVQYDEKGNPTVPQDDQGRPQLARVYEQIGTNPYRPSTRERDGAFLRAIHGRKLYYSALGGRIVDDKRLFRLISQYLVKSKNPNQELARPIESLKINEYFKFYEEPKRFVVKDPANSGGVGIYFPRAMPAIEVEQLVSKVRNNPGSFEIQYVSDIVTLPFVERTADGNVDSSEVAIDLRLFSMMDGNGVVRAGPNSLLLRTAPKGGLYTNTSRSGGYGIGVVLRSKSHYHEKLSEDPQTIGFQTLSKDAAGTQVVETLRRMEEMLKANPVDVAALQSDARGLSFLLREILEELNISTLRTIPMLREFADGVNLESYIIDGRLKSVLFKIATDMTAGKIQFRYGGEMQNVIYNDPHWARNVRSNVIERHIASMPTGVKLRPLEMEETTWFFSRGTAKVEIAEYVEVSDPAVQAVIDEVRAAGGEVRLLQGRMDHGNGHYTYQWEPPYFEVNVVEYRNLQTSYLKPIIAIDLSAPRSLPALKHELEHFRMWKEDYDKLRAQGFSHQAACEAIHEEIGKDEYRLVGERRAIKAEMQSEIDDETNPYSNGFGRAREFFELGYVNRMMYPEFEALRMQLKKGDEKNVDAAKGYMRAMVEFAVETRKKALEHWKNKRGARAASLMDWEGSTIFSLIARPYGMERIHTDHTETEFTRILQEVCDEMDIPTQDCGVPHYR